MRFIDLSAVTNEGYDSGRGGLVTMAWYLIEYLVLYNPLIVSSSLKVLALRAFGATIGAGVIVRPRVRVKCPWRLVIGDRCWIGEGAWLHNQGDLTVGHDSVISQESFITTGSHDLYRTMNLIISPVKIGSGVWITSRCIVLKGVEIGDNAVVTPGSVVIKSLAAGSIYGGNPAVFIRERTIHDIAVPD